MRAYVVRLARLERGETKTVRYIVNGLSHLDAVDSVLNHTGAPRSAVVSWEEADRAAVAEWRKELGI